MNNNAIEILLVEDDPEDAELTVYALKKYSLESHIVHIDNGEEALKFLYSGNVPSLILLDLRMPRVDGIQVLGKLKEDPVKRNIPVIVMLSSKEGKNYVESFKLRADAYITKPIDLKKFLKAIADIGLSWTPADSSVLE